MIQMSLDRFGAVLSWDGVSLRSEAFCLVWISRFMFVFLCSSVTWLSGLYLVLCSFFWLFVYFSGYALLWSSGYFIFIRCSAHTCYLLFLYFFFGNDKFMFFFCFFGGSKHAWIFDLLSTKQWKYLVSGFGSDRSLCL